MNYVHLLIKLQLCFTSNVKKTQSAKNLMQITTALQTTSPDNQTLLIADTSGATVWCIITRHC